MKVWRICKRKFESTAYSGFGASLYGGRWNKKGVALTYASGSAALAELEYLVHLTHDTLPRNLVIVSAEIPTDETIEYVNEQDLPKSWRKYPAPVTLQRIGTRWAKEGKTLVLSVPSAVVPEERNYLINPNHSRFCEVNIHPAKPFAFDPRLIKKCTGRQNPRRGLSPSTILPFSTPATLV